MIGRASERDASSGASDLAHEPTIRTGGSLKGHIADLARSWEVYFVVVVAAFLRLFHIEVTDFAYDQANVFRMAYGALHHGMLVATANGASIPILNPPAVIYLLMLPAAISANPLWAAVMVALSAVASVLLTYVFVRRYYGRLPATIAALLFATAGRAVFYSRFIWQQNFIPFFLMLFLFALFYGVVERRKGWLFPAIFLLGLLYQLHATSSLLIAPLVVAMLLAPGTLRWRDLCYGILSLVVLYLPYLLWELAVHFADIQVLLAQSKLPSHIDATALTYYLYYLSPYATPFTNGEPFTNTHSVLYAIYPLLSLLRPLLTLLLICGAGLALFQVLFSHNVEQKRQEKQTASRSLWQGISDRCMQLRDTPYRCGLLVLLIWQAVPLLSLSRHSLPVYPHYLIVLMPGQYILIGLFLAQTATWFRNSGLWHAVGRAIIYILAALIILAQFIGSAGNVLDYAYGNYADDGLSNPYYNDLHSLQNALKNADIVALQHHIHHIYIATDPAIQTSLTLLAGQIHTPATLFDDARCALLPNPSTGPVVMLIGLRSPLTADLITRLARATLVAQPARLGGPPFQLYLVDSPASPSALDAGRTFQDHLQALDTRAQHLQVQGSSWLVTRWKLLHAAQPAFRVTYGYRVTATIQNHTVLSECAFTSLQPGDRLLVAFPLSRGNPAAPVNIQAQFSTVQPRNLVDGPLTFETDAFSQQSVKLLTGIGKASIQLSS